MAAKSEISHLPSSKLFFHCTMARRNAADALLSLSFASDDDDGERDKLVSEDSDDEESYNLELAKTIEQTSKPADDNLGKRIAECLSKQKRTKPVKPFKLKKQDEIMLLRKMKDRIKKLPSKKLLQYFYYIQLNLQEIAMKAISSRPI